MTLVSCGTDQGNHCWQRDKRARTADVQICRGSNGQRILDKTLWCYKESFLKDQEGKAPERSRLWPSGESQKNLFRGWQQKACVFFLQRVFLAGWTGSALTHIERAPRSHDLIILVKNKDARIHLIHWWISSQMSDELKVSLNSLDLSEGFCCSINASWQLLDAVEKTKLSNNGARVLGKQLNIPCLHFFLLFSSNFHR